jgi:hypothetical protein
MVISNASQPAKVLNRASEAMSAPVTMPVSKKKKKLRFV